MIKLNMPIKVETKGSISLGPAPGTPEFDEEQAKRETCPACGKPWPRSLPECPHCGMD
jgi:hypothetical protein